MFRFATRDSIQPVALAYFAFSSHWFPLLGLLKIDDIFLMGESFLGSMFYVFVFRLPKQISKPFLGVGSNLCVGSFVELGRCCGRTLHLIAGVSLLLMRCEGPPCVHLGVIPSPVSDPLDETADVLEVLEVRQRALTLHFVLPTVRPNHPTCGDLPLPTATGIGSPTCDGSGGPDPLPVDTCRPA